MEKVRGGARPNAGRKSKVEEEKVNNIFVKALGELYNTETEEDTKIAFVKGTLMESQSYLLRNIYLVNQKKL